jgi:pantoate kinase
VEHFTTVQPVLVVWQHDESRHTSKYIDDDRWQRAISQAGERSVSRLKLKEWDFERWPDLMLESRNFAQESGLQEEPARKKLLSIVRKEILRLDLQARVNVRLCMLGISATILPRRLDSPLTESELGNISEALQNTGIGVVETRIH